ncbi:hypothetical protein FS837_002084 [Tulasnella sp. UAMH 9824]|nr:hypothetical protein FS837_002084 [Tulasnella sp. UAMH 9824]
MNSTLVTSIAGGNTTKGDFAYACAEVEIWETIEEAVRIKASRARQLRNALLPIQQLPTEVVALVLRMAVAPFREEMHYYTILQQISGVCHRFRQIIHGTPTFWSRIDSSDPPHIVDEALKRSAVHALDVRYEYGMSLDIFTQKVAPHIGRCRKVEMDDHFMLNLEHMQKFLALPAPHLEQLILRSRMSVPGFLGEEICVEQATRLKELEIRGIPCRWEAAAFRGLESLRISHAYFQSFNQILGLLNHSPCLLRLELGYGMTIHDSPDIEPTFRQINLPLLRNLSFSLRDTRHRETISDCIQVPSCTDLHLDISGEEQDIPDHIARMAASWLGQVQPAIPNPRSISIAVAISDTTLTVPRDDGQGGLSLAITHYPDSSNATRVLEGVNRVIVDHLITSESSLQLDNEIFISLDDRNLLNELNRLPLVTRLDIKNTGDYPESSPDWTADEHGNIPLFPLLKLLRLYNQSEEWIVHIIRALFLSPNFGIKKRAVNVELYFLMEEEREQFLHAIADTIKGVIGEGNQLSFMLAPSE